MGRRTFLLVAALVIAALGTAGILAYVSGVDERARQQFRLVEVLVASTAIPAGTSAADADAGGSFDRQEFLAKSVEGIGALSDLTPIADQFALSTIPAGSPILSSQFGASAGARTLPIPEGKLAINISPLEAGRVAGFVVAGSRVAIFLQTSATQGPGAGQPSVRPLLTDIEVLAVGEQTLVPAPDGATGDAVPASLLTVAVDQEQAQKLIYAQGTGALTLGLLDSYPIDPAFGATSADNLFD